MKGSANGLPPETGEGEKKEINSELWHACAGPLVSLPPLGSIVVYFPQGHSEQVAATMQKETDSIPNYPSLPSKLICMLHTVTLHADLESDEVYAQMTLQPVNKYDKDAISASHLALKQNKQPTEFFCKTLTASDTSTHGGFSVPRRAAEKIFPPLDFSMQPPAQELVAKDLHDVTWTFRHVYRGQPKRHLLTTGWSVFVSTKRLVAGDSVLFIRDEKSQLLLGIRRANRQQPALSSSVLSSDSMHIGVLAAAAHAAANNSPFTVFYNPRASPSEFVVPLAKYNKAMYTQVSLGMRFRMMFETEESGVRRYMGTITGISDLDPTRWKNSQWRNLQVGWDESTAGERQSRVSVWEIEPVATPFYICPPPFFRPKLPKQPGMPEDSLDVESAMPWLGADMGLKDAQSSLFPGLNLVQWMSMQQNPQALASAAQSNYFPSMMASALQNNLSADDPSRMLNFQSSSLPMPNLPFNVSKSNQVQQFDGLHQTPLTWPQQQNLQQQQPHQQFPVHPQQQHMQPPASLPQSQLLQPFMNHQQQQQHSTPINQQSQQQILGQSQLQQNLHQSSLISQQKLMQQQPQQLVAQNLQQHDQPTAQQQQLQQQQIRSAITNSNLIDQQHQKQLQSFVTQASSQHQASSNQHIQSPRAGLQQQNVLTSSSGAPQIPFPSNHNSLQPNVVPRSMQFQQQIEMQQGLSQKQPQLQQVPPSQAQVQLMLQKLQQQQMLSQMSPYMQSQLLQQQLPAQQNQQLMQQMPTGAAFSQALKEQIPSNQVDCLGKSQLPVRDPSTLANTDAPSCSASPFNNHVSSASLLNKRPQVLGMLPEETPTNNLVHELQRSKSDTRVKYEMHNGKELDNQAYRNGMTDQMEASSSATSFCMEKSGEENYSLPPLCLDGEVQADHRTSMPFGSNVNGFMPDTLLSRGFGSGRDLQNLLTGYTNKKDIETEISTAAISSQSFGVPDLPFKPGSNDAIVNENGVVNRGAWTNQAPRIRTYTKVQKRGSVGRSIDVTRYRGYDDLRRDLACMFGIDGQLEDPHRSDWKLVYVDHENDILLVGDDPWEEFVGCVQSIKILSAAEVQQMSLDGDLAGLPPSNQACSGSDNGNAWRE